MRLYKILKKNIIKKDNISIVPIRDKDRFLIMKWRNDQIYHLRQKEKLTKKNQDEYFEKIINNLFYLKKPDQILFSMLEENKCIGYGGIVHINWNDKNAELSFIMNSSLEKKHFTKYWTYFLKLIERVSFDDLGFHKVYVFAFDLRPHLYDVLKKNDFFKDARLKNHCLINGIYKDVLIYSKINNNEK